MAMGQALTTEQAAELLNVSKQTIYRYIRDGKLKSKKIGRTNRIPEHQIAEMLGVEYTSPENEEQPAEKVIAIWQGEDKEQICNMLMPALQATRHYADLARLHYERRTNRLEVVTAEFESGETVSINVSGDSGISLIRDIVRGLAFTSTEGL